jgi:hypothetical protein
MLWPVLTAQAVSRLENKIHARTRIQLYPASMAGAMTGMIVSPPSTQYERTPTAWLAQ